MGNQQGWEGTGRESMRFLSRSRSFDPDIVPEQPLILGYHHSEITLTLI